MVALLLGVAGASFAAALPLAGQWYGKEHQGLAMGIAGAGNSGTVLATLFANRLATHFGSWEVEIRLRILRPYLLRINPSSPETALRWSEWPPSRNRVQARHYDE